MVSVQRNPVSYFQRAQQQTDVVRTIIGCQEVFNKTQLEAEKTRAEKGLIMSEDTHVDLPKLVIRTAKKLEMTENEVALYFANATSSFGVARDSGERLRVAYNELLRRAARDRAAITLARMKHEGI